MSGYELHLLALAGALAAGAIGWQIVFGLAGALSLAAATAMGLGAYGYALAFGLLDLPFWAAVICGALLPGILLAGVTILIGHLESHYFALATLALAEFLLLVATNWTSLTGGANGYAPPRAPTLFQDAGARAAFAWAAAATAFGLFLAFRRRAGDASAALMRDAPLAAKAFGLDARRIRIAATGVGGVAGGLGGVAHAVTVGVVSPDVLAFKGMASILAVAIIGGRRSPPAAMLLALLVIWTPEWLRFLEQTYLVGFGVALLAAILFFPNGLAALLPSTRPPPPPPNDMPSLAPATAGTVRASGLVRQFGGLTAVDQVDLTLQSGDLTGLIGPNGAGKSTLLNILTGLEKSDAGNVSIPSGMKNARTFQTPNLANDRTAFDNVQAVAQDDDIAWAALAAAGLYGSASVQAGKLSQSDRRFLELARALSIRPAAIFLDEPAAGLTADERARLADVLQSAARRGTAILVVEHDVRFLRGIASKLVCMAEGRVIAAGDKEMVLASPRVIAAYVGQP